MPPDGHFLTANGRQFNRSFQKVRATATWITPGPAGMNGQVASKTLRIFVCCNGQIGLRYGRDAPTSRTQARLTVLPERSR